MSKTIPITGRMIRAVRKLHRPELGGWPIRMERNGQVAVYPRKNEFTGHHVSIFGIGGIQPGDNDRDRGHKDRKVHAYTLSTIHPDRLNEILCGAKGGVCTGHISGITCGNSRTMNAEQSEPPTPTHRLKDKPSLTARCWQYTKTNHRPMWVCRNFHDMGDRCLRYRNGHKVNPGDWIIDTGRGFTVLYASEFETCFEPVPSE